MTKDQIKSACAYAGMTVRKTAEEMGMTPQNFSNKLTADSLRDRDYKKLAEVLGGKYVSYIEFPNGTKI